MVVRQEKQDIDLVGVYEEMLLQRAMNGIRPVLYVSSNTDLECSMLMLLDETSSVDSDGLGKNISRRPGYYVMTN